jgi:hypothetical protein
MDETMVKTGLFEECDSALQASFRFSGIPVSAFFPIPEPGGRTSEIGNRNSEAGGSGAN